MTPALATFADAAAGLAHEMDLFGKEGVQIGLWEAQAQSLVCPRAYEARDGFARACDRSDARGWPLHLRATGGGTVPQGPGIHNLALAFDAPASTTLDDVYEMLTQIICHGIGPHGARLQAGDTPNSFCDGAWNLSVDGQKVVGTAQRWRPRQGKGRRPRVLAHALILTRDTFVPGAEAVANFHSDLGLGPVAASAHTCLQTAFGLQEFPAEALHQTAAEALSAFCADP